MEEEHPVLNKEFFEGIWPLITEKNPCDTKNRRLVEFYKPEKQFNYVWAHDLLSQKGFKNYTKPLVMPCYEETGVDESRKSILAYKATQNRSFIERLYAIPTQPISSIETRTAYLEKDQDRRKALAYAFANRKVPWYVPQPPYERRDVKHQKRDASFDLADPFELDILKSINKFEVKLMIIDAHTQLNLCDMERWVKFGNHVKIVVVVRCELLARRLALLGGVFHPVLLLHNLENTWQEELSLGLDEGVRLARRLKFFNCATPLVFIFARKQGIGKLDTFTVLRKF